MEGHKSEKETKKSVHEQLNELGREKELAKMKRSSAGTFVYYVIPLLSIAVFVGIFGFGVVPAVKRTIGHEQNIRQKKEDIEELDRQIDQLKELRSKEAQIEEDLQVIDSIVPSDKTQVAAFVGEIEELAKQHNLEEVEYESGENIEKLDNSAEDKEAEQSIALIDIPTTSEYEAQFQNMQDFLNALYKKGEFIIMSFLEMDSAEAREFQAFLQRKQGREVTVDLTLPTSIWTMAVTFEKYQFSKEFRERLEDEDIVPVNAEPDKSTLDYIKERFVSNEQK